MNKIIMGCDNYTDQFYVRQQLNLLKKQILNGTLKNEKPTEAQLYIREIMSHASDFLRKNSEIIVISSDKGGKVVIMERADYMVKMNAYLNENIAVGNYERVNTETLSSIRVKVEFFYQEVISIINPFLLSDGTIFNPLRSESYVIPLLYGGPKIHKQDVPMRPIVASTDMIGSFLSEWLLGKLRLVADCINKYNIINSKTLVPDLKNFSLEPEHELCTFDYVSMFTNVNVAETIEIILKFYHVIAETTSVQADVFIECLHFFTRHATYFMFNGNIFKQIRGLAMGNRLAQVLAEIRTNYALYDALKDVEAEIMSFLYKYVDDIFSSMHRDHIDSVAKKISESVGMEITVTKEDINSEVEFLDCIFRRNQNLTVTSRWLKKYYSSLSILNFHSYHPVSMKRNVMLEMIRNAFAITSPEFIGCTELLLCDILGRSSYPDAITNSYVKPFTTTGVPKLINHPVNFFVSCPYFKPSFKRIKSVIHRNKLNKKLAPKPISNNRRILFSRVKDVRDASQVKNSVIKICCSSCAFTHLCTTGNLNVQRTFQRLVNDEKSPCGQHILDYPNHSMDKEVFIMKTFYNKFDADNSQYFFKQIEKMNGRRMTLD